MTPGSLDCPFCGDAPRRAMGPCRDTYLLVPGEFDRFRCDRCGLHFLTPRPDPAAMARFYPPRYWDGEGPGEDAGVRQMIAFLQSQHPGGQILDVGCGAGSRTALLARAGLAVMGLEPYAAAAEQARERYGLSIHEGDLQHHDLPPGTFDAVTMFDVLEHLESPAEDLIAARQLLRPGGHLLVKVPHAGAWQARVLGSKWYPFEPRHLQMFTAGALRGALTACGYRNCRTMVPADPGQGAIYFETSLVMWLRARQWRSPADMPELPDSGNVAEALSGKVYAGVPARGKRAFRWALRNLAYAPLALENWCGGAVNLVGMAQA